MSDNYCKVPEESQFVALMIVNEEFRNKIKNAKDAKEAQGIAEKCGIKLTTAQMGNVLEKIGTSWAAGYMNIIDISKLVYDPGSGDW